MKATVKQTPRKSNPYPKLMTDGEGLIVLMSDHECGTVVVAGQSHVHEIGGYCEGWDMDLFHDFEGIVELQNVL